MNRLFVAKYTGSHDEVEADGFILLQLIGGDLGVLVHRILLAQCPQGHPRQMWGIDRATRALQSITIKSIRKLANIMARNLTNNK